MAYDGGEDAALLDLAKSFLTHPVFHVSLLAPAEEEPPRLRWRPVVPDPARGEECVIDAVAARRKDKRKVRGGLEYLMRCLDGTETWEPEGNSANAKGSVRRHIRGEKRKKELTVAIHRGAGNHLKELGVAKGAGSVRASAPRHKGGRGATAMQLRLASLPFVYFFFFPFPPFSVFVLSFLSFILLSLDRSYI